MTYDGGHFSSRYEFALPQPASNEQMLALLEAHARMGDGANAAAYAPPQ